MARGVTEEDPFAIFHAPPLNETPEDRVIRELKESEAKRVSDEIDEQLKADRVAFKSQKNIVQVLLLGQAESGEFGHPSFCACSYRIQANPRPSKVSGDRLTDFLF
jgi:hypothetical protein